MKVVDNDTNAFSEYMVALKIILIIILIIINMIALKIILIIIIIRSTSSDQAAMKLPKSTADEQKARDAAMQVFFDH